MAEIVPMPKLGFDMAEGKLVRKVVPEGQPIKKGEVLAEVETDKATVEVEAYVGGVVKKWLVEEGQSVPVGEKMVVIGAADEQVDLAALGSGAAKPAAAPTPATPAPAAPAAPNEVIAAPTSTASAASATGPASPAPKANGQPKDAGGAESMVRI